jgi:hypothetical protein
LEIGLGKAVKTAFIVLKDDLFLVGKSTLLNEGLQERVGRTVSQAIGHQSVFLPYGNAETFVGIGW